MSRPSLLQSSRRIALLASLWLLAVVARLADAQTAFIPTQLTPAAASQAEAQYQPHEAYINADEFYVDGGVPGEMIDASVYGPSIFDADSGAYFEGYGFQDAAWSWHLLPDGLIYKSYLAGVKESRLGATFVYEEDRGWLLDSTLGGRVGIVRYGTDDDVAPEGFQIDVEAAAFPRLDLDPNWDLVSSDFRAGVPFTYGRGKWRAKFAYYHLSSHLGDEEIIMLGTTSTRINFARDALVLGGSYYPNPSLRLYSEAAWAFYSDGGSDPWEFQFGVDYSPVGWTSVRGTPFFAVNGHLRQELNYSGNVVAQLGWQWRGRAGHLLRLGFQYYDGLSDQYQFYQTHEQQYGLGLWYDF